VKRLSPADKALISEAHERALAVMEIVEEETDTKFSYEQCVPRDHETMLEVVKMIHGDFSYSDDECPCSSMSKFNRAYDALVEAGVL
jgi:hypothetical protein